MKYNYKIKINTVAVLLLLILMLTGCSANTSTGNVSENAASYSALTPSEDMKKLVLVVDKHSFNAEYDKMLNVFNHKLAENGKKYYLEIKVLDNLPKEKEKTESLTSYCKTYQDKVNRMKANNESADIITMTNTDDSSGLSDYDAFYSAKIISSLDSYLKTEKGVKLFNSLEEKIWQSSKRDGEFFIVPSTGGASFRGWNVEKLALKSSGITEKQLQCEIWEITDNPDLSDKKLFFNSGALNFYSGSGSPIPINNAEAYYDLITSCVGVKLDDKSKTAINIYEDDYIQKSVKAYFSMSSSDEAKVAIDNCTVSNYEIIDSGKQINIPINNKGYIKGTVCGLGIADWSKNKDEAFDLIYELNTNKELATLLNYGIEGENYTLNSDGSVSISDSQFDTYRNLYYFSNNNVLPYYELLEGFHTKSYDNVELSPICGFIFDKEPVKNEIKATNAVVKKYSETLLSGIGDYEKLKAQFDSEMQKAGIQKIVDEANRQISAWSDKNS